MVQDYPLISWAVLKSFTGIIFNYVGQTPSEICSGEIEKNEIIKSIMKRQVLFIQLIRNVFFTFCCLLCYLFLKKCLLHFLLLVMLFAHVAKRSNSRSQIFLKQVFLNVPKNFGMFTGKRLCWSRFLRKVSVLKGCIFI